SSHANRARVGSAQAGGSLRCRLGTRYPAACFAQALGRTARGSCQSALNSVEARKLTGMDSAASSLARSRAIFSLGAIRSDALSWMQPPGETDPSGTR